MRREYTGIFGWGKVAAFVGSALFGSAGVKILTSKDAKKVYTYATCDRW